MERKLFLEKMNNTELKELVELLDDLDIRGYTNNEKLRSYADTWYSNTVGLERLLLLRLDVYSEIVHRWAKEQ